MKLTKSAAQSEIPATVVDASSPSGAEHVVEEADWWVTYSTTAWVTVDLGASNTHPAAFFSIRCTNASYCAKDFTISALMPELVKGSPTLAQASSKKYFCERHSEAWKFVAGGTITNPPADPPFEVSFSPVTARFWKLAISSSYGTILAINRIKFNFSVSTFGYTLHDGIVDAALAEFGSGVSEVYEQGSPGVITLYGASAFPIMGSQRDDGQDGLARIGGAIGSVFSGRQKPGKVVAFTHDGYISVLFGSSTGTAGQEGFCRMVANVLRWCVGRSTFSMGILGGFTTDQVAALRKRMGQYGVQLGIAYNGGIETNDVLKATQKKPDVIIFYPQNNDGIRAKYTDPRVELCHTYLRNGGTILTGQTPWGWEQRGHGQNIVRQNNLLNHLLGLAGMAYTSNYLGGVPIVFRSAPGKEDKVLHLGGAIVALREAQKNQGLIPGPLVVHLCEEFFYLPKTVFSSILVDFNQKGLRRADERDDGSFAFASIVNQALCAKTGHYPVITFPINNVTDLTMRPDDVVSLLAVAIFEAGWQFASPEKCPSAQAIDQFPGTIPPNSLYVEIMPAHLCLGIKGRQSTGIYVPAGKVVTLEWPAGNQNISPIKPEVRVYIGCHTDVPTGHETLDRWPRICIDFQWKPCDPPAPLIETLDSPQSGAKATLASPYGGLLHLEIVNSDAFVNAGVGNRWELVWISGGVLAPWYSIEREPNIAYTKEEIKNANESLAYKIGLPAPSSAYPSGIAWSSRLKDTYAPWAELEGRYVVLSVPRYAIEDLQDPEPLVRFWDSVIAAELHISGQQIKRKERLTNDVQISAGYMHAGYPVMTMLDVVIPPSPGQLPSLTDVQTLKKNGSWGVYHEFGHNRQQSSWTFDGAGEVTVNIFSLYTYYVLHNEKPYETKWFSEYLLECAAYLDNSSLTYDNTWMQNPGIALGTYACYLQKYGFDAMHQVFLQYIASKVDPQSDNAKRTQWVIETSKAVKIDLRNYYTLWKWPFDIEEAGRYCSMYPKEDWSNLSAELRAAAPK